MKCLSCLVALWVFLLSTLPCFLQDDCLFCSEDNVAESGCTCQDEGACSDCCCSPFLHCNTCTGCPRPKLFQQPLISVSPLSRELETYYDDSLPLRQMGSLWQPPQLFLV